MNNGSTEQPELLRLPNPTYEIRYTDEHLPSAARHDDRHSRQGDEGNSLELNEERPGAVVMLAVQTGGAWRGLQNGIFPVDEAAQHTRSHLNGNAATIVIHDHTSRLVKRIPNMAKSTTKKIVIFEPDEEQLNKALADGDLSPALVEFLNNLLKTKKWTRKINIPSGHNDVAAVLVFTTALKEEGLEILSEIHIFCAGKIMVEKWQVVGGAERISLLPKEAFHAINIDKVRVQGAQVNVEFSAPTIDGHSGTVIKTFDFSVEAPEVRLVPHPLDELGSAAT